jgi:glutaconate CoA-transferase subunit B
VSCLDYVSTSPRGRVTVVTDLGVLDTRVAGGELALTTIYPGVDAHRVRAATGWDLVVSDSLVEERPATASEISALRALQ